MNNIFTTTRPVEFVPMHTDLRNWRFLGMEMEALGTRLDAAREALSRAKSKWSRWYWTETLERLMLQWRSMPARCLIVPDGFVDADLCGQLHLSGTAVLHAVGDPRLIVPAALNQPHRHRLDAYGLPLPEHTATIEDECLVVRGPAGIATGPLGTETAIGARIDADGFIVPAHD